MCDHALRTCANLQVGPDEVLTVNVQSVFGPTQMRVFDAEGVRQKERVVGDGAPF